MLNRFTVEQHNIIIIYDIRPVSLIEKGARVKCSVKAIGDVIYRNRAISNQSNHDLSLARSDLGWEV